MAGPPKRVRYNPRPHYRPFRRKDHRVGHVERLDVLVARRVMAPELKALEADRDHYKRIAMLQTILVNELIQRRSDHPTGQVHLGLSGPWLSYEKTDPETGAVLRHATTGNILRKSPIRFTLSRDALERMREEVSRSGLVPHDDVMPVLLEFGATITHQGGEEYS